MSTRKPKRGGERLDAFGEKTNLEQVADEIYGASAEPELNTGRVVARPTPLKEIWADVRQPRRAVPASIRLVWNGNPADVPNLLNTWAEVAADAAGRTIDIQSIILGEGDGLDTDNTPSVYESFIDLLRLAASILQTGLINPITILDQRDRNLIESGERRWLAYWLLHLYTQAGDEFARIPAVTVSGADFIWRQAAENTARRSLNAVSMSRQLALLVMAARGQDQYADYDQIVPPGASDRRYYAQVADGNIHRIPKGAGERIQGAMGLSESQLAHYRRLLRITDDDEINDLLWLRGDIEDWPEGAFRDASRLTIVNLREILARDSWSYADFRADTFTNVKVQPPTLPLAGARHTVPSTPRHDDESEEARRVLSDIRQGFGRVYAAETGGDEETRRMVDRVTRLLNEAQRAYDSNHLASANAILRNVFHALDADAARLEIVDRSPTPPPQQPSGMSKYDEEKLLKWAWRWAMGHLEGGGWFTQQECQSNPGDLGSLVMKNFLQQGTTSKGSRDLVRYRITPVACRYLGVGFDVIDWDAREQASSAPLPAQRGGAGGGDFPSDKSPSAGSDPIITRGQPVHEILERLRDLAATTGHQNAVDAVIYLLDMTWERAHQDADLQAAFQMCFDEINVALSDWSQSLSDLLDHVIDETG